ncbi:MAG: NAD(P)H-dependent oxidoreductase [Nitrospira sp.]|nr:NAD(P)H-dependent oxidoreductase [Nitrospira sp.]
MIQLWRVLLLCASSLLAVPMIARAADSPPTINVLVAYHSLSGHTERMAEAVVEGARSVPQTQVVLKRVGKVTAEELFAADAIVLGSPVYWSNMAGEVKAFIDDWQFKFGVFPEFKLRNKVGAAFATGGQISSGKELTMLSILAAMLGNQMIIVSGGGAFGASATTEGESPGIDVQEMAGARDLGRRVADVAGAVKRGFESQGNRAGSSGP